jgi:hypothetical protein
LWRERGDRRSDHVNDEAGWSVDEMERMAAFLGTRWPERGESEQDGASEVVENENK